VHGEELQGRNLLLLSMSILDWLLIKYTAYSRQVFESSAQESEQGFLRVKTPEHILEDEYP